MKKTVIIIALAVSGSLFLFNSCESTKIASKSGVQLWAENCSRCHNAPTKDQYSAEQWGVIGTHMKLKATLTDEEVNKIVAYLQAGR